MRAAFLRPALAAMVACGLLVILSGCTSLPKGLIAPAHYGEAKQAELRKLAETDMPKAIEGLVDLLGIPEAASGEIRSSFKALLSELLVRFASDYSSAVAGGKLDRALSLRLSLLALGGDGEASACLDAVGRSIVAEGRSGLAQEELAAAEKAAGSGSFPRAEQLLRALLRDLHETVDGDPGLGQRAQALAGLLGLTWSGLLEGAHALRLSPQAQAVLPATAVPTLRSLEPSMVATVVKGVVTVRVDRGIKIEQGVGTLDRMIGSGFFIDSRGYLITNYHVIASEVDPTYEGFSRVALKLAGDSDSRIPAKVIGWDPLLDIALLKVDMKPGYSFRIGRSGLPPQGQAVYAFGSPAGLDSTITSGIVSAVGRKFLEWGDVFQIDAALNPGNSGGPVLDADGEVRGIAFAGLTNFQGLNFAIPAEWLLAILPTLYEGGKVAWPWLGLQLGDSTAQSPGLEVLYRHPSALASIHEGERILSVDGHALSKVVELQAYLMERRPGDLVSLEVSGASGTRRLLRALGTRPDHPLDSAIAGDTRDRLFLPLLGMKVTKIKGGVFDGDSYSIETVRAGSLADEAGLSPRDPFSLYGIAVHAKERVAVIQFHVKKRSSGYLESMIQIPVPLDVTDFL